MAEYPFVKKHTSRLSIAGVLFTIYERLRNDLGSRLIP